MSSICMGTHGWMNAQVDGWSTFFFAVIILPWLEVIVSPAERMFSAYQRKIHQKSGTVPMFGTFFPSHSCVIKLAPLNGSSHKHLHIPQRHLDQTKEHSEHVNCPSV